MKWKYMKNKLTLLDLLNLLHECGLHLADGAEKLSLSFRIVSNWLLITNTLNYKTQYHISISDNSALQTNSHGNNSLNSIFIQFNVIAQ